MKSVSANYWCDEYFDSSPTKIRGLSAAKLPIDFHFGYFNNVEGSDKSPYACLLL